MTRVYRYRLKVSATTRAALVLILDRCRDVYNAALQERRDAWGKHRKSISFSEQCRSLTEIRRALPEYGALPRRLAEEALRSLDLAFAAFFRRVETGEKAGYPRFKSRDRYDSFGIRNKPGTGWSFAGKHLRIGDLRVRVSLHRPLPEDAKILGFRVKREGRHWYVSFALDLGAVPEKRSIRNAVGIDLGVTSLVVLSDGTEVPNPRYLVGSLGKLVKAQYALSAKPRRRSNRRDKAKQAVARLHRKVRDQRHDYLHVVSKDLVSRYDLIAHEDLNIRNMLRRGEVTPKAMVGLHRSIADAAWGTLIGMITYKAEEAGTWVIPVDPRGTTSTCARCGRVAPKRLDQREHDCPCGYRTGRDDNAALIVLHRGVRWARGAEVPFAEPARRGQLGLADCR